MMAYVVFPEQQTVIYLEAGGALSTADVGKLLKNSSGQVVLNDSAAGDVVGVLGALSANAVQGDKVPVIVQGLALVQGDGTVAALSLLQSSADGQAAAKGATAGRVFGRNLEALAAGQLGKCLVDFVCSDINTTA